MPYREIAKGLRVGNFLLPGVPSETSVPGGTSVIRALVTIMPDDPRSINFLGPEIDRFVSDNKILHINPGIEPKPNLLPHLKDICEFIDKHMVTEDDDYGNGKHPTPSIQVAGTEAPVTILPSSYPYVLIHGNGKPEWNLAFFLGIAYIMWKPCVCFTTASWDAAMALMSSSPITGAVGQSESARLEPSQMEQLHVWGALGDYEIAEPYGSEELGLRRYKKVYSDFLERR